MLTQKPEIDLELDLGPQELLIDRWNQIVARVDSIAIKQAETKQFILPKLDAKGNCNGITQYYLDTHQQPSFDEQFLNPYNSIINEKPNDLAQKIFDQLYTNKKKDKRISNLLNFIAIIIVYQEYKHVNKAPINSKITISTIEDMNKAIAGLKSQLRNLLNLKTNDFFKNIKISVQDVNPSDSTIDVPKPNTDLSNSTISTLDSNSKTLNHEKESLLFFIDSSNDIEDILKNIKLDQSVTLTFNNHVFPISRKADNQFELFDPNDKRSVLDLENACDYVIRSLNRLAPSTNNNLSASTNLKIVNFIKRIFLSFEKKEKPREKLASPVLIGLKCLRSTEYQETQMLSYKRIMEKLPRCDQVTKHKLLMEYILIGDLDAFKNIVTHENHLTEKLNSPSWYNHLGKEIYPITLACMSGNLELINYLISEFKLDLQPLWKPLEENSYPYIMEIVWHECVNLLKFLVNKGMNPNFSDPHYGSLLGIAIAAGNTDIVNFLLIKGADLLDTRASLANNHKLYILKKPLEISENRNALHEAIIKGDHDIIQIICDHLWQEEKATKVFNQRDIYGKAPLDYANESVCKLIKDSLTFEFIKLQIEAKKFPSTDNAVSEISTTLTKP